MINKITAPITLAQAIGFAISLMVFGLTAWGTTQTRITILEVQMKNGDIDRGRIENKMDRMLIKLDKTDDNINEVKILINNKEDKK